MTLSEFMSKFFSRPTITPPTTLYVFESEDSADSWIECKYFSLDNHNYELVMVLQSDMILEYIVKEKWCNAEVQQFYAVKPDVIVIVVEPQESEQASKSHANDEKISQSKQWWIFTFGSGQKHAGHYVKIQGTFNSARQRMIEEYGKEWGFQYLEEEWIAMRNDKDRLWSMETELKVIE